MTTALTPIPLTDGVNLISRNTASPSVTCKPAPSDFVTAAAVYPFPDLRMAISITLYPTLDTTSTAFSATGESVKAPSVLVSTPVFEPSPPDRNSDQRITICISDLSFNTSGRIWWLRKCERSESKCAQDANSHKKLGKFFHKR